MDDWQRYTWYTSQQSEYSDDPRHHHLIPCAAFPRDGVRKAETLAGVPAGHTPPGGRLRWTGRQRVHPTILPRSLPPRVRVTHQWPAHENGNGRGWGERNFPVAVCENAATVPKGCVFRHSTDGATRICAATRPAIRERLEPSPYEPAAPYALRDCEPTPPCSA